MITKPGHTVSWAIGLSSPPESPVLRGSIGRLALFLPVGLLAGFKRRRQLFLLFCDCFPRLINVAFRFLAVFLALFSHALTAFTGTLGNEVACLLTRFWSKEEG